MDSIEQLLNMGSDQFLSMGSDQFSVEVNSDGFSFYTGPVGDSLPLDFDLSNFDEIVNGINISGTIDSEDLKESITLCVEPNEFDLYLGPDSLPSSKNEKILDFITDINDSLAVFNTLPVHHIEKNKKAKSNKKQIPLSQSVAVGVPQRLIKSPNVIEIVNELEEKFRPRYKSDYFTQQGTIRKPRYVTDRFNNHFITIKVPLGVRGQIRVDWLTIANKSGDRYCMPYRFQINNDSLDSSDCNPTFVDIKTDATGTMKLYLVLIKAKQDALRSLQPLKPFHPIKDALEIIDKPTPEKFIKLTPKQLIQQYQLGKSQLAFTLCTLSTDGQSCIPQWDTMVVSTILEEETNDSLPTKTVACPNCAFQVPIINDDCNTDQKIKTNKRKSLEEKPEKLKTVKKQNSLPEMLYCVN